jgi:hypothetical protein
LSDVLDLIKIIPKRRLQQHDKDTAMGTYIARYKADLIAAGSSSGFPKGDAHGSMDLRSLCSAQRQAMTVHCLPHQISPLKATMG